MADNLSMANVTRHPVDRLSDAELRDILFRVDVAGFPSDLEHLWRVERVRFRETLRRIPPAKNEKSALLDLGGTRTWLPFFQLVLGYRRVTVNTNYPNSGFIDASVEVRGAPCAELDVAVYDVERDEFPHADDSFDVVTCLEVLEHLCIDPMGMLAEVNRVLKPGGTFVLTTPNAVRSANVASAMLGEHPYGWAPYNGFDGNRHNREYTPGEVERLLRCGGFSPSEVTTFGTKKRGGTRDALRMILHPLLGFSRGCPWRWRRDIILAVGSRASTQVERRPSWLYFDMAERAMLDRSPRPREIARGRALEEIWM